MLNRTDWMALKEGSIVTLRDTQTLMQNNYDPQDYTIESMQKIVIEDIATYLLFKLQDNREMEKVLMAKIVGKEMDLRVYSEVSEFKQGNREDMIDEGMYWLFQAPEEWDETNPNYSSLMYAYDIEYNGITFKQKEPGELNGTSTETDSPKELLATLVEYKTNEECDNPELLLIEIGSEENENGGLIILMEGRNLDELADIEVLPSK